MDKRVLRPIAALVLATAIACAVPATADSTLTASCGREVDSFIRELRKLNARLNVGLTYSQYSERLGDISITYQDLIDVVGDLDRRCITVALRGEKAYNLYLRAKKIWGDCIDDFDCSTDSIEGRLQKNWAKASKRVKQAWGNIRA
jgi:hypothetical protein